MDMLYHRRDLARRIALQLLHPGVLDEGLRSGLFIYGPRRTGKTTFLQADLVPELEAAGALVVYVDLWSKAQASPADLLHAAVRRALADIQLPANAFVDRFKQARQTASAVGVFKFGFKVDSIGAPEGVTLAQAFTQVVDQTKCDLVLIVDEVQHAITSQEGRQLLLALKSARDAVNLRQETPGHFLFVGAGSHPALVSELTSRASQAFFGATAEAYPVLDADFIKFLLARLARDGDAILPSVGAATAAFQTLGARPEEMLRALRVLASNLPHGGDPDSLLPVIAATLQSTVANVGLANVNQSGAIELGINSDSINYEVALEKLGQSRQPVMEQIRLEREKAVPNQAYLDYCRAVLAAVDQLQGDLEPDDRDVIDKILAGSLIGVR